LFTLSFAGEGVRYGGKNGDTNYYDKLDKRGKSSHDSGSHHAAKNNKYAAGDNNRNKEYATKNKAAKKNNAFKTKYGDKKYAKKFKKGKSVNDLDKFKNKVKFGKRNKLKRSAFNNKKKRTYVDNVNSNDKDFANKLSKHKKSKSVGKNKSFAKHGEGDDNYDNDSGYGKKGKGGPSHAAKLQHKQAHGFGNDNYNTNMNDFDFDSSKRGKNKRFKKHKAGNSLDQTNAKNENLDNDVNFAKDNSRVKRRKHASYNNGEVTSRNKYGSKSGKKNDYMHNAAKRGKANSKSRYIKKSNKSSKGDKRKDSFNSYGNKAKKIGRTQYNGGDW